MTPNGTVSLNHHEISLPFLEHWGSEIGDQTSSADKAPSHDSYMQCKLLDLIGRFVLYIYRTILDAPITALDWAIATQHMKSTSAPDMDGLTAGFYQVASSMFGECLKVIFN